MPSVLSPRNPIGRAIAIAIALSVLLPVVALDAEAGLFGSRRGPSSASGRRRGGGIRTGRLVGGTDPSIPYVTSPRHTWLEEDSFTITWNPVDGASDYTVSLWRWSYARDERDALIWQTTTSETRLVYPGDPDLELGRYYSIEVITDTGVSSSADAGNARAGFEVLFSEDIDLLRRDRRRILGQELAAADTAFTLAALYAEHHLYADAIAALMPLVEAGTADPWIYKALGDIHSYIGLNLLASDYYRQAHDLAIAAGDEDARAAALESLGEVSAILDRLDDAIDFFQAAQHVYRQQSADWTVSQLQRRIELLQRARQARDA